MTANSMLALDQQICFALYSASRSLTAKYRDLLAPLGITYPQYLALLVLWENSPMTVGALAERLQLDSGTVSPLLRRLVSNGVIEKIRSESDERIVLVRLTAAGRALEAAAAGIPAQICAATGFGLDEVAVLRDQITELTTHVRGSLEPSAR